MTAPARLLSVRLQGFKSFAERTHVAFGPGISAVVGPNGSGKSNLADALRWALGEQGRALRSRKSEDVIWAGSERRSALGMADVQLVLDNADRLLPVEYGVVELGRRLYRSGENDYLLNRQRVRLRDLVDLLDAGHLAENAFLFIGQGMVDQALALRPEERRPLFEEVAGVRRHERRRRRAEEQLAEAESNLARVEDILAELRPQARRLATQAEQQASRRSAGDALAAGILVAAHARWHAAAARVSATTAAVAGARSEFDRAMAVLTEHEEAAAGIATILGERAAGAAERRSSLDVARIELTTLRLREGRVDADLGNVDRERDRLAAERHSIEADIASAQKRLAEPATTRDHGLDAELGDAERALAEALEELAAGRGEVGADDADLAAVRRLEGARQAELDTARRRLAEAERQAAQEGERAAIAGRLRATAEAALMEARSDIEQARAVVADTATARDRSQAELRVAEAEMQRATETLASVGAALASVNGSLEAAAGEIAAAEGGTFAVAARASGGRRLDRDVRVDPSFRRAVDAALGSLGSAYVVKRTEIDRLAGQRGVAVVAEALAPAAPATDAADRRFADLVHGHGGGILSEAVRRDDSGAVNRLLERTAWLPDLASCLELQAAMPAGWLLVSRAGGASVGQLAVAIGLEDGLIGRRAEAQRLTSESSRLAAELETARRSAEASEARRDTATTELGRARDIEATAIAALRLAEDRERTLARAADAAIREAAWLEAQALRLAAEAERARAALPPGPVPESAQSREPAERPGPDAAVVAIWEARVHEVRQRRDRIAALVAAADAGRQETDRRRAGAEASLAMAQSRVAGLDTTSATVAEREAGLRHERDELSGLLAGAVAREQGAHASLDVLLAEDAGDRDRLAVAEVSAGLAREQVRVGQIRAQGAERDELEARLGLENLREQLLVELTGLGRLAIRHLRAAEGETEPSGNLAVEPELAEDADADADADAVEGELEAALETASRTWARAAPPGDPPSPARLANLRRRFHELGAGNPFAVDEYATLKARLDGLEAQRLDLQGAIDRTRGLILELDALITSQFRATFQALELAFDARFQQLFGGGFARLSLTDPSDLSTTGVEIVARPPGKKPQALAMLSGGERALTAVALLFAMLEVRPVPFCVLDEVDAALDEANIGRFTDALRELSQNTQCIVITHNRGTIEIADALYGVTVGEDSVSRVISLRLEDATAIAGRSRSTSPLTSTVEPLPA